MKSYYIFFALILFSCTKLKKENAELSIERPLKVIKVDPTIGETVKLSDLYESISFIPLETSDNCLIDQIEKIIYSNEKIFVLGSGSILIFDHQGKFLSKIEKRGLGPEEYRTLWDMQIDTINNLIEVLDTPGRKMLTFDFNGNILDVWKHDLIVEAFYRTDHNNYLFYCGNNFNGNISTKLLFRDKSTKTLRGSFFNVTENQAKYLHFKNNKIFSFHNDSISYVDSFNDTVFVITEKGPKPRILIDFGKFRLPHEMLEKNYDNAFMFSQEVRKNKYAFLKNSFFENDSTIFFAFEYEDEARLVYYFKNSGETKIIKGIKDDVIFNNLLIPDLREYTPVASYNDKLIYIIQPSVFIGRIEDIKQQMSKDDWKRYIEQHPDIINIFNKAGISDNPILCLTKIKS